MTSSWFFLSTLNYDARSTTHQMVYTLRCFSSKCSLFHNSNLFGSCIIHILHTVCAKIKKNNSGAKRLMLDTPCSEVEWRVLATHSTRMFPLHFRYRASPCAITFQLSYKRCVCRQCHCGPSVPTSRLLLMQTVRVSRVYNNKLYRSAYLSALFMSFT